MWSGLEYNQSYQVEVFAHHPHGTRQGSEAARLFYSTGFDTRAIATAPVVTVTPDAYKSHSGLVDGYRRLRCGQRRRADADSSRRGDGRCAGAVLLPGGAGVKPQRSAMVNASPTTPSAAIRSPATLARGITFDC